MIHTLEKMAEHKIMSKRFLRNRKMEKKDMIKLLSSAAGGECSAVSKTAV